jgi:hypothetical protein
MPSEKLRYLKNRPRPPVDYWDMKNLIGEESTERLTELLMLAGERSDALGKALYVIWGSKQFEKLGDYKLLEEAFLYAIKLDDFVSYDQAGAYDIVVYELVGFFKKKKVENKLTVELIAIKNNLLPKLESAAELLQDENSWFDAVEELRNLI